MKIAVDQFKGISPRLSPRSLQNGLAVTATNARLLSTDLEAWQQVDPIFTVTKTTGAVNSAYLLAEQFWLTWAASELQNGASSVDCARGPIPDDDENRTYFTGLDRPRWTNIYAAQGCEPTYNAPTVAADGSQVSVGTITWGAAADSTAYPILTFPLGVPAPTGAPTVTVTQAGVVGLSGVDNGSDAGIDNWTKCPQVNEGGVITIAATDGSVHYGSSTDSYVVYAQSTGASENAYLGRSFGYDATTETYAIDQSTQLDMTWTWQFTQNNKGDYAVAFVVLGGGVHQGSQITYEGTVDPGEGYTPKIVSMRNSPGSSTTIPQLLPGTWYSTTFTATRNADGTVNCAFFTTHAGASAKIDSGNWTQQTWPGGWFTVVAGDTGVGDTPVYCHFELDSVTYSGTFADPTKTTATEYILTYVNMWGEESAPGPTSALVELIENVPAVVTMETDGPPDLANDESWGVVAKNLYRAVSDSAGTQYQFVAQFPLATATYNDNYTDAELGEVLQSEDWDLPPTNMQGMIALPNGIMAGFYGNTICLSATDYPHAWPVGYQQSTDADIVGLGGIDSTLAVMTNKFPYLMPGGATGDTYSMTKVNIPQGCVSKRGIVYQRAYGIIYPSADGLIALSGIGIARNITEQTYTSREWKALNPASFIAVQNDDKYFAAYEGGTQGKGTLVIDCDLNGFGAATLDFHWTAVYGEPLDDSLYFVPDYEAGLNEPSNPAGFVPAVLDANYTMAVLPTNAASYMIVMAADSVTGEWATFEPVSGGAGWPGTGIFKIRAPHGDALAVSTIAETGFTNLNAMCIQGNTPGYWFVVDSFGNWYDFKTGAKGTLGSTWLTTLGTVQHYYQGAAYDAGRNQLFVCFNGDVAGDQAKIFYGDPTQNSAVEFTPRAGVNVNFMCCSFNYLIVGWVDGVVNRYHLTDLTLVDSFTPTEQYPTFEGVTPAPTSIQPADTRPICAGDDTVYLGNAPAINGWGYTMYQALTWSTVDGVTTTNVESPTRNLPAPSTFVAGADSTFGDFNGEYMRDSWAIINDGSGYPCFARFVDWTEGEDSATYGLWIITPNVSTTPDYPFYTPDMNVYGLQVYEFNADPTERRVYDWVSKLYLMPRPICPQMAQVRAADYANLTMNLYANQQGQSGLVLYASLTIENELEFTLPMPPDGEATIIQVELKGTSTVHSFQLVEDVDELE